MGEITFSVNDWYNFTEVEKRLLRRSWKTVESDDENIACNIYRMIFDQCPEAQRLFTFTIPPRGQERQCNEFAFQALRFIQILESGINNLNNLKAIEPILDNLGRRHGKLKSSVGFRPYYWTVFMECTIHHLRLAFLNSKVDQWSHKDIDNAIMLWRHLILGICQRIKDGYLKDIANRSNMKTTYTLLANERLPETPTISKPKVENAGKS